MNIDHVTKNKQINLLPAALLADIFFTVTFVPFFSLFFSPNRNAAAHYALGAIFGEKFCNINDTFRLVIAILVN